MVIKPEESPGHTREDSLTRKSVGSLGEAQGGNNEEMMDDLDEMVFGKKAGGTAVGVARGHNVEKHQSPKDDLNFF